MLEFGLKFLSRALHMILSASLSRRQFLLGAAALPVVAPAVALAGAATDVRIRSIDIGYEDFLYRVPIKFGGRALDRVTLLNVHCAVEGRNGRTMERFESAIDEELDSVRAGNGRFKAVRGEYGSGK